MPITKYLDTLGTQRYLGKREKLRP